MDPLQASWLVKACCVLHNRCFEWGLHKLMPGQNQDPTLYGTPSVNITILCVKGDIIIHISVCQYFCAV